MERKKVPQLLLFMGICLLTGWLGGAATASSRTGWYAALQKPPLNPPDWIFAPVWTLLYLLMAAAGWILWNTGSRERLRLRVLWTVQLALNGVWSFLFFGLQSPWIALTDILILWVCLFVLIQGLRLTEKTAGLLLIPYFLWVSFAAYLNAALWWLNR